MEVEYGIGVANRFAFLAYKDIDKEEEYHSTEPEQVVGPKKKNSAKKLTADVKSADRKEPKTNPAKGEVKEPEGRKDKENKPLDGRRERGEREFHGRREFKEKEYKDKDFNRTGGNNNRPRRNDWSPRDGPPNKRTGAYNKRRDEETEEGKATKEPGVQKSEPEKDENSESSVPVNGEVTADAEGQQSTDNCEDKEPDDSMKPEPITFTLTEWKAMQASREKPVFNVRKAGEGEDVSKFGKMILKKKESIGGTGNEEELEMEEVYYPQRSGRMKQISDVGFTTGYQRRRGGRGGFGGNGGVARGEFGGNGGPGNGEFGGNQGNNDEFVEKSGSGVDEFKGNRGGYGRYGAGGRFEGNGGSGRYGAGDARESRYVQDLEKPGANFNRTPRGGRSGGSGPRNQSGADRRQKEKTPHPPAMNDTEFPTLS